MSADTWTSRGAQYWLDATDTHKAEPSYYELVENALHRVVLPLLRPEHKVLDFGCGDGEYSRLFAQQCSSVRGIDVSEPLILAALRTRPQELADRLDFVTGGRPPAGQIFDMVSCMGVLVCVLEDEAFSAMLGSLADAVVPGGHLVLRETLAWNGAITAQLDGYVAHYRTPLQYLELLADHGLELLHDEYLATWSESERRSNHLWVLQRIHVT